MNIEVRKNSGATTDRLPLRATANTDGTGALEVAVAGRTPASATLVAVTMETDLNGHAVLRVVDAAPWAYNATLEATRTAPYSATHIHHNAATATGNGTDLACAGLSTAGVQIKRTAGTSTVIFQGSIDGTNFVNILAVDFTAGTSATSTTAEGIWQVDVTGLTTFRVRLDAVAGGAVTVTTRAVS